MEAAKIILLYNLVRRDFQGENLSHQSFEGQDLSGADFSNADIRSTNFTNAVLVGANFTKAKAGLKSYQDARLAALLLIAISCSIMFFPVPSILSFNIEAWWDLSTNSPGQIPIEILPLHSEALFVWFIAIALSVLVTAVSISFLVDIAADSTIDHTTFNAAEFRVFAAFISALFTVSLLVHPLIIMWLSIDGVVDLFLPILLTALLALMLAAICTIIWQFLQYSKRRNPDSSRVNDVMKMLLAASVLTLGLGLVVAALVTLASVFTITISRFIGWLLMPNERQKSKHYSAFGVFVSSMIIAAVLLAFFGLFYPDFLELQGVFAVFQSDYSAIATFGIVLTVMLVITYPDWNSLRRSKRVSLLRSLATTFATIGGTSFRGADLTDADFTEADLRGSDFRHACLARTHWGGAKYLSWARSNETLGYRPHLNPPL